MGFAERLIELAKETWSKMTPDQKAENERKSAEGWKHKQVEAAAAASAPSAKRVKGDIKNLPDTEKAKIKCKFWSSDPAKNKCRGDPCLFKHE